MKKIFCSLFLAASALLAAMPAARAQGSLTGAVLPAAGRQGNVIVSGASFDLTASGTLDWAHWGLTGGTSFEHKATGGGRISGATVIDGGSGPGQYSDPVTLFAWSDGTTTSSVSNTGTGIFTSGGFEFTVPADTNSRVLKVYVGGSNSSGKLTAHLLDRSSPDYVDTDASSVGVGSTDGIHYYVVYTLVYQSAKAGQTLDIKWERNGGGGFVNLQSAALYLRPNGPPDAPKNPVAVGNDSEVLLTFDPVIHADFYLLKRSVNPNGPFAVVGIVPGPPVQNVQVVNGVTYYYVIMAQSIVAMSDNSIVAPATPMAAGDGSGLVSANFAGGGSATPTPMAPTEVAGVAQAANWNNLFGATAGGMPPALNDSAGGVTSARVDWEGSPNTGATSIADTPGNNRLMKGYLDTNANSVTRVTLLGLNPADVYQIYVYANREVDGITRAGQYTIGNQSYYLLENSLFNGSFTQAVSTDPAHPDFGNYVVFTVSGQSSYLVTATPDPIVNGLRAPINGIQIQLRTPTAPLNLTALGHNSSAQLYWNSSLNAASYAVKRSLTPGGPYSVVATGLTALNYLDTGLVNGTTYYYVVVGVNSFGAGGASNEAAVTPGAVIAGSIGLEGVNNLANISPNAPLGVFDIQLRAPGSLLPVYEFSNVTLNPAAGTGGGYTLTGVAAGTYDVRIKGSKNLAVLVSNVLISGNGGVISGVLLPAGDTNGDNSVDASDFGAFVSAYNTDSSVPGGGYDPTCDFNFDGAVDPGDFGLFVGEYNSSGAP